MLLPSFKLLFHPDAAGVDTGSKEDLSIEQTIEQLSDDTGDKEVLELDKPERTNKESKKEDKTEKEAKAEEKDDEGEEESLEDELEKELKEDDEEVDDEKLELTTPINKRQILAKYPDLFKDFPYLEKSYYREKAYAEILPTIAEAKEAVEKAETLDNFEKDLASGNTEQILASVHKADKKAFNRIVDNYLPTLAKIDEKAYHHVIGNIIKHTIVGMITEGRSSENETLSVAAQILNQYVFGSSKFEPITSLSNPDDNQPDVRNQEIEKREREFLVRQFETNKEALTARINNIVKSTIDRNIDPKDSMTEYVKKNAIREAKEQVEDLISKDKRFKDILDRMWESAAKKSFNAESMDKIKSAYLSKAKSLLPIVIKKARNEALRGLGKRVVDDDDDEVKDRKGPLPAGKPRTSTSSPSGKSGNSDLDKARQIPAGMKSVDYLMQD